ncbi:hypothetical protein GQ53DRAFT_759673 [Thozetella sp. PMI_491]|nr:hypothetical protein GQ53DRAFT_759673 [Thozetella sp. PMI_491]
MNCNPAIGGSYGNQTMAYTSPYLAANPTSTQGRSGCIFGLGIITIIFTAVRIYFVFAVDFNDVTYSYVVTLVWGHPPMRPVFDNLFRGFLSSRDRSSREKARRGTATSAVTPGSLRMGNGESKDDLRWEMINMGSHNGIVSHTTDLGHPPPSNDSEGDLEAAKNKEIKKGNIVVTRTTVVNSER